MTPGTDSSPDQEGSAQLAPSLPCSSQTREEDECPGSVLSALCRRRAGCGRRGELELNNASHGSRGIRRKTRGRCLSACFADTTQKWFPFARAVSVNTLCFLLALLSPDTDSGTLGDTQLDTRPLSCCEVGRGTRESRPHREAQGVGLLT